MYIKKIIIKNFRLLKDFQIDLEKGLSLIVGKNNTGKTSLLTILQMFLSGTDRKDLTYSDFNLDFRKELKEDIQNEKFDSEKYEEDGIKLRLVIEYDDDDNLEYLSKAIITLEPDNNYVVLGFDYILTKDNLLKLRADYVEFERKESENAHKGKGSYTRLDIDEFLDSRIKKYFSLIRKSIMFDIDKQELDERKFSELKTSDGFRLEDVITFKYISAKRDVDNIERQRTLSSLIADLYEVKEKDERLKDTNEEFKSQMRQTDKQLNNIYKTHFKDIINIVQNFTGVGSDDFKMKITSTLRHKDILNRNVSVVYNQNNQQLPESHNGLGYMNLIAMIVDIERIREEMKREDKQKPADINLLFIEEPEAHTHPQMQYIFIKNIKKVA